MPDSGLDLLAALRATPLFAECAPQELEPLLPVLRSRTYPRGSHLFHAGDPPIAAWAIVSGLVKTCHFTADGDELVVSLHWPGQMVGEFWLLDDGGSRFFDAIAAERTETIVIGRQGLQHVLDQNPRLLRRVAVGLIRALMASSSMLNDMRSGSTEARIARQLVLLATAGATREGNRVYLQTRVSQGTLAGLVGATREHVNRALRRLVDSGVVGFAEGQLVIMDERRLQLLAAGR